MINAKWSKAPSVRIPEAIADIQHRIFASPYKSVQKLSLKVLYTHRTARYFIL